MLPIFDERKRKSMNEQKFTHKGQVYADARPSYPKELFDYLQERRIITPEGTVADIGSGTGIFTTQIAAYAKTLYAVEPNEDMRRQADAAFRSYPNIVSVNGTAEQTSLQDHSVDCVTVAQAFHWFDRAKFRKECMRILKDHKTVVLVWNDRDPSSKLIQDNYQINSVFCPNFKGSSAGISFLPESFDDFFKLRCEYSEFLNVYRYDISTFLKRNLSSSYAPHKNDIGYTEYVSSLTAVFDKHSVNGIVEYPYITRCYSGEV